MPSETFEIAWASECRPVTAYEVRRAVQAARLDTEICVLAAPGYCALRLLAQTVAEKFDASHAIGALAREALKAARVETGTPSPMPATLDPPAGYPAEPVSGEER